jgi:iron complex transport system permease protein
LGVAPAARADGDLVGGVLGCVGCAFQGLLRNSLADPYIVGVSSGAAVGAAVGVLLGWHLRGWVGRLRCWRSAAGC